MRIGADLQNEVSSISVHVGLALTVEFVLHAIHHPGLNLHLEVVLFRHEPDQIFIHTVPNQY